MLPERRVLLEDEPCPVPDEMLGEMYRASPHGLSELIRNGLADGESLARRFLLPPRPPCLDRLGDRGNLRERRSDLGRRQRRCRAVRAIAGSSAVVHRYPREFAAEITLASEPLRQPSPIADEEEYLLPDFLQCRRILNAPRPIVGCVRLDLPAAPIATPPGSGASSITALTTGQRPFHLGVGHFEHELVVHLQQHLRRELLLRRASSMRIMARRMMSAALPCSRALIAARSLKARIEGWS